MEISEIKDLKRKHELKKAAKVIEVEFNKNPHKQIEGMIDALYECYENGENVCTEVYANIPEGFCVYNIYSCDIEGKTKEEFIDEQMELYDNIENAEKVIVRNGSFQLPENMRSEFQKGENIVYAYKRRNGMSAVFTPDDFYNRTEAEFLDYATLVLEGKTIEEKEIEETQIQEKSNQERKAQIEKIEKQMPQWIEEGNSLIFLERQQEWKNFVESYQGENVYYASIIGQALEVMKSLEETKSVVEAEKVMEAQAHSGASMREVVNIVFRFSKKGPNFYEDALRYVFKEEIDQKTVEEISNRRSENHVLAYNERIRWEQKINNTISEVTLEDVNKATRETRDDVLKDKESGREENSDTQEK